MRVIQVTSASIKALGARRPDAVIPSLSELPDAVARLGRERRRRPGAGTPPG
jgi:hypothetical protein